jgi:hypothetical protein
MGKMTYSQVVSAAKAELKKYYEVFNKGACAIVYKDAGGDFQYKLLTDPCTIIYTSIKAMVYITLGLIYVETSREVISRTIEKVIDKEDRIDFIYFAM